MSLGCRGFVTDRFDILNMNGWERTGPNIEDGSRGAYSWPMRDWLGADQALGSRLSQHALSLLQMRRYTT